MDLLDYASDSSESPDEPSPAVSSTPAVTSVASVSSNTVGNGLSWADLQKQLTASSVKKVESIPLVLPSPVVDGTTGGPRKRKWDATLLPAHIQRALASGGLDSDDDSDDERRHSAALSRSTRDVHFVGDTPTLPQPVSTLKATSTVSPDPLLAILPPPRDSSQPISSSTASLSFTGSSLKIPTAAPEKLVPHNLRPSQAFISSIVKKTTTSTTVLTAESSTPAVEAPQEAPSKEAFSKEAPSNEASTSSTTPFMPFFGMSTTGTKESASLPNLSAPFAYTPTYLPTTHEVTPQAFTSFDPTTGLDVTEDPTERRKRERRLESALLSAAATGNPLPSQHLDALAAVTDKPMTTIVASGSSWDSSSYIESKAREAAIRAKYNQPTGSSAVSREANYRHQLASLPAKAAATEIALQEARVIQGKGKAATKAKYGW